MITCDTSFLYSLYILDVHTQRARARLSRIRRPEALTISPFIEYELPNAIRLSVFRNLRDAAAGATILAAFEADQVAGHFDRPICNLASVVQEAKRLSSIYTMHGGHRTVELLHVATALHLGATEFLSFDLNQRNLATAVGLTVGP